MFRRTHDASAGDSNPDTRPLPPRLNLERERKQAKALLRQLRAGDPDAFARARARHSAFRPSSSADITLADAQLVLAREYGFASWPRLVQYFGDVERQRMARHSSRPHDRAFYESNARALIAHHRDRRAMAGRSLAASVPRFHGKTVDEVFASSVTEDDARLTIARENGCASWEVLMETIEDERARQADPWSHQLAALKLASTAINAGGGVDIARRSPKVMAPTSGRHRAASYRGVS